MRTRTYTVGIYSRLSSDSRGRKNESIETQVKIAKAYMERQPDLVLYDCYSDLGKTGTSFAREGFERLMADVRSGRVDCIIVKDFSRFGRNYIETGNYIQKIFPFLGVRFISVTDHFDSLTCENDEIGVNLKNLANEMYARDIAVKVKSSKRAEREAGSYTGGLPPYGYRVKREGGKRVLYAEEEAAEIVRKIYRLFEEGKSVSGILAWLYEQNIHRPAEYRRYGHVCRREGETLCQWGKGSVRAVLTNPVYMGCLAQAAEGKKRIMRNPVDMDSGEWRVKRGTHVAIVSEEQFFCAAQKFWRQAKKTGDCGGKNPDPFGGVLFCGLCGKRMGRTASPKTSRSGEKTRRYSYFCRNSARIDGRHCENDVIAAETLTSLVSAAFVRESALNGILPEDLLRKNAECVTAQKAAVQRECDAVKRKQGQAAYAGSVDYAKYREGTICLSDFQKRRAERKREAEQLAAERRAAEEKIGEIDAWARQRDLLLCTLPQGGGATGMDGKLIRALLERMELYPGKRVKITFRFAGKGILKRKTGKEGCGNAKGRA